MNKAIAVLSGDGIGPEVMEQCLKVLGVVEKRFHHRFHYHKAPIGGEAYDKTGKHCPLSTLEIAEKSDAILFGSVGGPVAQQHKPKWQGCEANSILTLRKHFNFNINIRPITIIRELNDLSPLQTQSDMVIFRELNGDIYFGDHKHWHDAQGYRHAQDDAHYDETQIEAIAHSAFQAAQKRSGHLVSVDKANVLATSSLWRFVMDDIAQKYPDVKLEHMYVDNCAMQMVINPAQFDVVVTANLFGDILSDLGAALPGSLGLIPSASLNAYGFGLYEPSGGSAFDIAGDNVANPVAQILSAAMMLEHSFNLNQEAKAIQHAVKQTLQSGYRTADLTKNHQEAVSTQTMTAHIIDHLEKIVG